MRAMVATAICAALALAAMPAGASGSARKPSSDCPPKHTHTLVADRRAVVYKGPARRTEGGTFQPEVDEIYGCVRTHGRSYVLGLPPQYGSPTGTSGTEMYRLSGAVVAFEAYDLTNLYSYYREDEEIVVRDLRNGRTLHKVPTGTGNSPTEREHYDVGIGDVTALVVKSDGAVAWIVNVVTEATVASGVREYQIHAVDKAGSRVLAAGADIEPESLTLTGSTLHWEEGGKRLSATLH